MSSEYTESDATVSSSYEGGYTTEGDQPPKEQKEVEEKPEGDVGEKTEKDENEENKEEVPESTEENQQKLEEPVPEPDPLEGITYDIEVDDRPKNYGDKFYWEARYVSDTETFEWYQQPEVLQPIMKEYVDAEGRVLVVGNGTSDLPSVIAQNGCESCVSIDFAKYSVKLMKKRNKDLENVKFVTMDAREMSFGENEFQAVVDKGCLDSMLFLADDEVNQMISEISRVLKNRGVYICVSYHGPDMIYPYINNPAEMLLEVEKVIELPKQLPSDTPHYCYIVRKVGKLLT